MAKPTQAVFENELRKQRQMRYDTNTNQKDAYMQLLKFIKARKAHPLEVEKQILEGIKVILENGWLIST